MQVIEVTTHQDKKKFIEIAVQINRSLPNYIRPIDKDIDNIFYSHTNSEYKYGKVNRWLAIDENKKPIGRIAAFITSRYVNYGTNFKVGGIGFFECINNTIVSTALFDTAKKWLLEQGMEAMDGPINFGSRDQWWGLMIKGLEQKPLYGMSYNPPYYQQLFEEYGFKNYAEHYWYQTNLLHMQLNDKIIRIANRYKEKSHFRIQYIEKRKLRKYLDDLVTIYNLAFVSHLENKYMTKEDADKYYHQLKHIIDRRIIRFVYYDQEPAVAFINIPDINVYIEKFNGKWGWWQKIQLYIWLLQKKSQRIQGLVFAISPKFQGKGADAFMYVEFVEIMKQLNHYHILEVGWTGDWHPKMISLYESLPLHRSRTMVTYRYIFNNQYSFERHPTI